MEVTILPIILYVLRFVCYWDGVCVLAKALLANNCILALIHRKTAICDEFVVFFYDTDNTVVDYILITKKQSINKQSRVFEI